MARNPWDTSSRNDFVFIFFAYWASGLRLCLGGKQVVEVLTVCVYEDPTVGGSITKIK